MIDLRQRLRELDQLEAPDMKAEIERRAAQLLAAPDEPILEADRTPSPWRGPLIALGTAAAILIAVAAAALMLRTDPSGVTDEPAPPTTVAETAEELLSVESLTWSRVPLDQAVFPAPGPGVYPAVSDIVAGGPGLVAVGTTGRLDLTDTPPSDDPTGWIRGTIDIPTVWTSPDGYTWSRVPYDEAAFGVDSEIKAVTAGGPGLVAVGDTHVWTSPDGYTWSRVGRDPGDLRGVIAGGPGLVAFGESAGTSAVWTSPDGYTWTQVPHDGAVFGRSSMHSMIVGGPGLVAVGVDETNWDGPATVFPAVWTSPDGYTWTRVPHDQSVFPEGAGMVDVAVGSTGLVAVGFDRIDESLVAAVWSSPDGFTWTRVPHDEALFGGFHEDMSSVAAVGDGFIAVGSWAEANVWTSPDGITWNRIPHDEAVFGDSSMLKVITGGPGVVVLGSVPERPAMWVATPADTQDPALAPTTGATIPGTDAASAVTPSERTEWPEVELPTAMPPVSGVGDGQTVSVTVSGVSGRTGHDLAGVLYEGGELIDLDRDPLGGFWSVITDDDFTTTEVMRQPGEVGMGRFPFITDEALAVEPGTYTLVIWVDHALNPVTRWVPINTDGQGLYGCHVAFEVGNDTKTDVDVPANLHPDGWNTNCTTGATIPRTNAASAVTPSEDSFFTDPRLVADASGAAPSGGSPLPEFDAAIAGDDEATLSPLGAVATLPDSVRLDFLFEFCWGKPCFRDGHFMAPGDHMLGSGPFTSDTPFHVRHGFVNEGDAPLGPGFDVVLYVTALDQPGKYEGQQSGATYRYTSDYVIRETSEACGPTYRSQQGPVTCEVFVHEFEDGLPEGRHALWAVWEAPCSAWVDYGFTESCTNPDEVLGLFTSGFDSPFGPHGPSYNEASEAPGAG